jgi:hypothetical protein
MEGEKKMVGALHERRKQHWDWIEKMMIQLTRFDQMKSCQDEG